MESKETLVPGAVKATADAVAGVLREVPIYQDLAQPAVRQVGQAIEGAIRVALAPVTVLVWGYDRIKDYLENALAPRLAHLRQEEIITPSPTIAGPAIEALRFAGHDPTLREMYANLLATAMDANRVREAHPAFVEILRQLTPDEARIIQLFQARNDFPIICINVLHGDPGPPTGDLVLHNFSALADMANCQAPELVCSYIDNICRLGLAQIDETAMYSPGEEYVLLENHPLVLTATKPHTDSGRRIAMLHRILVVTTLGKQFCRACLG